jgi:O-acetyl-ADP-ribose deacetylase
LPTGEAVATTAGRLPACWVIHTVGPVWSKSEDRSGLLRSCYERSLEVARELGAESIAFPLISSGVYRWPADHAVEIAMSTLGASGLPVTRLVLFSEEHYALAVAALPS